MSYVFHGSPTQGLTIIKPQRGIESRPVVYAGRNKAVAALFLGRFAGDLACQLGIRHGVLYIVERYPGALRDRFSQPGSIYVLPDDSFVRGTHWSPEWISFEEVNVYRELKIDNPPDYLKTLARKGRLIIYRFPHTGPLPAHERDLVRKYAGVIRRGGRRAELARWLLETKRPDLLTQVSRRLERVGVAGSLVCGEPVTAAHLIR